MSCKLGMDLYRDTRFLTEGSSVECPTRDWEGGGSIFKSYAGQTTKMVASALLRILREISSPHSKFAMALVYRSSIVRWVYLRHTRYETLRLTVLQKLRL